MERFLCYVSCWMFFLSGIANAQIDTKHKSSSERQPNLTSSVVEAPVADRDYPAVVLGRDNHILAQISPTPPPQAAPIDPPIKTPEDRSLENRLIDIKNDRGEIIDKYNTFQPETSPGFSIFNPVGFGADNNLLFLSLSYQNRTRFTRTADGEAGIGVGLGDGAKAIGAEISYGIDSFGSSAGFGSGAFSIKLHRRLNDDASVAVGWNQFARIQLAGGANVPSDYPRNSYFVVGTNIFRTNEDINAPFSRIALTGGIGSGVFLRFDPTLSPGASNRGLNVFGSVGVRIARPISAIVEWTGQDLGVGLSIAPFKDIPIVITPAIRDLAGAGDGARFVLGTSIAINF
jgi:hypothetical protein